MTLSTQTRRVRARVGPAQTAWLVLALCLALAGCRCTDRPEEAGSVAAAEPATPGAVSREPGAAERALFANLDRCELRRAGATLDLGTPSAERHRAFSVGPFDDLTSSEIAGASFAAVTAARLDLQLWTTLPLEPPSVGLRLRRGTSDHISVYVDGERLGALQPTVAEPHVHSITGSRPLAAGLHTLTLRFSGRSTGPEPRVWLDWVRLGPPLDDERSHAAATRADVVRDVALGKLPRRSVLFRADSVLRCPVQLEAGAVLRFDVGAWGQGSGVARVRVLEEGEEPRLLDERELRAADDGRWQPVELDLSAFGSHLVTLELGSGATTGAARVAFGEPRLALARKAAPSPAPRTDLAIVVIGAGLSRRLLPPWGPHGGLGAIARLARLGVAYDHYRVPTTLVAGVVASLLTGLPARAHRLGLPGTRLPAGTPTLAAAMKQTGGQSAMFTAVPATFGAFGFDAGWDRFETSSPVSDESSTRAYDLAADWLRRDLATEPPARRLVVIHGRGAHPPWDVTRDEARDMPPAEYDERISPRRAALQLADEFGPQGTHAAHLRPSDWQRMQALEQAALRKEDAALGALLDLLERNGRLAQALVIFVGDVANGEPPRAPFALAPPLDEERLLTPLLVKFPGNVGAGTLVRQAVTTVDVARTIATALGLAPVPASDGVDLGAVARSAAAPDLRPLTATLGTAFSTQWGPWLLRGRLGEQPKLCRADVDPECTQDRFASSTLAGPALWSATYEAFASIEPREPREPPPEPELAQPDEATNAALRVFGY